MVLRGQHRSCDFEGGIESHTALCRVDVLRGESNSMKRKHSAPDEPLGHRKKCLNKHCHCIVARHDYCGETCATTCDGSEDCQCMHDDCDVEAGPKE